MSEEKTEAVVETEAAVEKPKYQGVESRLRPLFNDQPQPNVGRAVVVTPELEEKIKNLFLALEDALIEAFPNTRYLSQVLSFLEIAAFYALRLLK